MNKKYFLTNLLPIFVVVIACSLIFAFRYTPAFSLPNFYAEDGKVFIDNVLSLGYARALVESFNGYLVVGQYLVADAVVLTYNLLGLHFYTIPKIIAFYSCLVLGLTVSLPYILFRKDLGTFISLSIVTLGAFVPVPLFDYAIIGTIGNLKFIFLYWAFLFVIYRNLNKHNTKRVIISDIILFLCIVTYAPAILLLPFTLYPYKEDIYKAIKLKKLKLLHRNYYYSLFSLTLLSIAYLVVVYVKEIPKIPGYLDSPFQWESTMKIINRVTLYSFDFPIIKVLNDFTVLILLIVIAWWLVKKSKSEISITIFSLWAIIISTVAFIVNRPGISIYFLKYDNSPDQFFFAQTLIFVFMIFWLLSKIEIIKHNQLLVFAVILMFVLCTAPLSSSMGKSADGYRYLGTAYENIARECTTSKLNNQTIVIQSYPTVDWKWEVAKSIACK